MRLAATAWAGAAVMGCLLYELLHSLPTYKFILRPTFTNTALAKLVMTLFFKFLRMKTNKQKRRTYVYLR